MICKVKNTIERHRMLENITSVAVGVSGGADSMCLLHILSKLKEKYGIILKAVHINHGIRGNEALRDENAVREYCEKEGIELLVFHKDIPYLAKETGLGEEECGRKVRYECFREAGCDAVATAHSLSDSIETMIFNLVRGSGSRGLCGIPPVREDNIIRPLIDCTREEIEAYCRENSVPYVTDSTNLTDDYKRNFIRHNIVPAFSQVNSGYAGNISSALDILRCESSFIESEAGRLIEAARCDSGYLRSEFLTVHEAVRKRAVSILLEGMMNKSVEKRHIDLTDKIILSGEGKIEISKDLYICCESDIIAFKSQTALPENWECDIKEGRFDTPYGVFILTKGSASDIKNINALDGDKLCGTVKMTSRRQGDRFYFKRRKITKSLKKLFNEDKIPEEKRGEYAVLRCGDSLVWLEGYGTDGNFLPGESTKNILIIKKEG